MCKNLRIRGLRTLGYLALGFLWCPPPLHAQTDATNRDARQEARQRLNALSGNAPPQASAAVGSSSSTNVAGTAMLGSSLGVAFNPAAESGLLITDLAAQGVFAQAGFQANDRILSLNGQPVASQAEFLQTLTSPSLANQIASVVIERGGQTQSIALQPSLVAQTPNDANYLARVGLTFDQQTANQMVIAKVAPQSAAFMAGLRSGDSIATVNGQAMTREAFSQALQSAAPLTLSITRGGQVQQLTLSGDALTAQSTLLGSGSTDSQNAAAASLNATATTATLPNTLPGSGLSGPAAPAVASGSITPGGAGANVPFAPDALNGAARFSPNVPRNPLLPGTAAAGPAAPGTAIPFSPDGLNGANRFSPLMPNPAAPGANPVVTGSSAANAILQSQSITNPASAGAAPTNTGRSGGLFSNPANPASSAGSLNQSAGGFSAAGAAGGTINPVPSARTGNPASAPAARGAAPATSATGGAAASPAGAAAPAAGAAAAGGT